MWQAKMLLLALWCPFKCFMGPLGASSSFIIYTVSAGFRHALSLSGADTLWTTEFHVRIIFLRGKMWIFWEFPNVTWLFFHIEGEIFKTSKVTAHEWNLWSSVSQAPQTELYYSTRNVKPPLHLSSSLLSPPSFHLSRPKPLLSTLTPSTPTTSYIKMLQRSLKERRPPRQMQRRRPPSPRMLKAKV